MKEQIGKIQEAGTPILARTDAPGFNTHYVTCLTYRDAITLRMQLSIVDVLKTATPNISKAFGLGNKGYIKEGNSADLLLIDGDLTEDISVLSNIIGI